MDHQGSPSPAYLYQVSQTYPSLFHPEVPLPLPSVVVTLLISSGSQAENQVCFFLQTYFSVLFATQYRVLQYMNHELPDVQAGFRKGRGTGDQIANIRWITEKAREFQKNICFCFIDYAKAFDYVDHNKLENSERDGNTRPPACLLRNLYAGQEATVRTGHGTTDWFQIGKRVCQGWMASRTRWT